MHENVVGVQTVPTRFIRFLQLSWDDASSVSCDLILSLGVIFADIVWKWRCRLCIVARNAKLTDFPLCCGKRTIDPEAANDYDWDLNATQFIIRESQEASPGVGISRGLACTLMLMLRLAVDLLSVLIYIQYINRIRGTDTTQRLDMPLIQSARIFLFVVTPWIIQHKLQSRCGIFKNAVNY